MRQEIVKFVAAMLALFTACRIDQDEAITAAQNRVGYAIDGIEADVAEGLALALLDETKHLLGPHTHLFVEAGVLGSSPDKLLGHKLRVNIPANLGVGTHEVRFTSLPSKEHVWVEYRVSRLERWVAYAGEVRVKSIGGVGERLRIALGPLKLGDACGRMRTLDSGNIDVLVGSEDAFPVSQLDMDPGSEWAEEDATDAIENAAVIELEGVVYACDNADLTLMLGTPAEGPKGATLYASTICSCNLDPERREYTSSFSLAAFLPPTGEGVVLAKDERYSAFLLYDVNHTQFDPSDDDLWISLDAAALDYHKVGSNADEPVDIELVQPVRFAFLDSATDPPVVDRSRRKTLRTARFYGLLSL